MSNVLIGMDNNCKKCRYIGEKLFLKGERCFSQKCSMIRNSLPPGVHGSARKRAKSSDFKIHLKEKQALKFNYGLGERQLKKYFNKYSGKKSIKGTVGNYLLQELERRLDNAVFKSGFALSKSTARQLVSHGHFMVNNKRVNIPSYRVKIGDIISIRPESQSLAIFKDIRDYIKKHKSPDWLSLDKEKLIGEVKALPTKENTESPFNMQLIVEYYSR